MKQKNKLILSLIIIILAGFAAYGNSLNGQFLWDDKQLIQDNSYIKSGGKFLGHIFTNSLRASSDGSSTSFRPLQTFSYLIDYSVWHLDPLGYHLVNVSFHVLAALVIFWMVQILFSDLLLSFLTAFLFVLHPVHTEAVAYVSGRADSMVLFFMILSFCLYLKNDSKSSVLNIAFMSLSYLCALLSRENGLILPALILFYHFAFKKPIFKKAFISIIAVSLVYIVWRGIVFKGTVSDMPMETTLWQRTPGIFIAFANYIRLLFIPFGLHMEYGGLLFHWNEPKIYSGLILLVVMLFWGYKQRKDNLKFFSVGWFLIALFPLSNIYALNAYMAEHWLYMPSVGFFLLLAYFISSVYRNQKYRLFAVVCFAGLTLYYGGMTIYQNHFWQDPVRFYKRMLKFNKESVRLYTNLVSEYIKAGKQKDLIHLLEEAMKIDPTNEVIYNNLGIAYNRIGKHEEAINIYKKAIELNPDYGLAYYNIGIIYADVMRRPEDAIPFLTKAIARDSSLYQACHRLALIYLTQEKKADALVMLKRAVEINPDAWEVYRSLGFYYMQGGDVTKAIEYYRKSVELNPKYVQAYGDLAVAYYTNKQMSLAVQFFDQAEAMGYQNPQFREALKPYR